MMFPSLCWIDFVQTGTTWFRTSPKTPDMSDTGHFLTVQPESRSLSSPLTPVPKKSAFWKTKVWFGFLGGRRCAKGTSSGWMGAFFGGRRHSFFGEVFLESTQKMVPRNLLGCYLKSLSNLEGSFEKRSEMPFFFWNDISIQKAKCFENLRFGKS